MRGELLRSFVVGLVAVFSVWGLGLLFGWSNGAIGGLIVLVPFAILLDGYIRRGGAFADRDAPRR